MLVGFLSKRGKETRGERGEGKGGKREEWHTRTTACDESDETLDGEEVAHVDGRRGSRGGCYGGGHGDFVD